MGAVIMFIKRRGQFTSKKYLFIHIIVLIFTSLVLIEHNVNSHRFRSQIHDHFMILIYYNILFAVCFTRYVFATPTINHYNCLILLACELKKV